jgi:cadherin EGF LAG seven-pass G-type receptor 1
MVVHNNGSIAGCPEKRDFCASSPCKNSGKCANGWGSYVCTCKPQWTGKNCATAVGRVFGMDRGSEVTFQQELSPIQLPWQMSLSFRTRSLNGTLLAVKMGDDNDVYKIDIRDGVVVFVHHQSVLVSSHTMINDNIWHDAQVSF